MYSGVVNPPFQPDYCQIAPTVLVSMNGWNNCFFWSGEVHVCQGDLSKRLAWQIVSSSTGLGQELRNLWYLNHISSTGAEQKATRRIFTPISANKLTWSEKRLGSVENPMDGIYFLKKNHLVMVLVKTLDMQCVSLQTIKLYSLNGRQLNVASWTFRQFYNLPQNSVRHCLLSWWKSSL